jgi:hypothetical protein
MLITAGMWSELNQVKTDSYISWFGFYFCVGYDFVCGEVNTYIDKIAKQCYAASYCPLAIPDGWDISSYKCPFCINQMCDICDPNSRITCSSCIAGTNSFLNTTTHDCDCAIGYIPLIVTLLPAKVIWQGST